MDRGKVTFLFGKKAVSLEIQPKVCTKGYLETL